MRWRPSNSSAEAPPTYSLSWVRSEGAESCPAGRALVSEVERRLGRKVFDASAERAFEVVVSRAGDTFKSDVYVRDASGATVGHRALSGDEPGCGPLLNATALAIALVIDPEAAAHQPSTSGAFEPPPAPEPPPALEPPPAPGMQRLRLTPKKADPEVERVFLDVDPGDRIRAVRVRDAQGNESLFEFDGIRENVGLPERLFRFEVPRGVEVVTG